MQKLKPVLLGIIILIALYFRASGLFHGLDEDFVFHPDTPKQVTSVEQGLLGRYIYYSGDFFTDGYPFGLNRIDEVIIRAARACWSPVYTLLRGRGTSLPQPERVEFYYMLRVLRLLYGMVAFGLLARTAFLLFPGTRWPYGVMLMAAVAPLSMTVTHFASGDIGLDLFLAVTLYSLARHVQTPKLRWGGLAGLGVGMAFACKYQGLMGGWMVALYLLIRCLRDPQHPLRTFFLQGITAAGGFLAGVFLLTPGLWVDTSKTWKLIRQNIEYVKGYAVPPEFLELPVFTRLRIALSQNIPDVTLSLGLLLVLIALGSLLLAVSGVKKGQDEPSQSPRIALWVSVASFPFVVVLLSTAMKPMVQPFHFSFVVAPLILSVGFLAERISIKSPRGGRLMSWALIVLVATSSLSVTLRENALWRMPGIIPVYRGYISESTLSPLNAFREGYLPGKIKSFYVHPPGLPAFRNERRIVVSPHAAWWNAHGQLHVPSRPLFDTVPGWIFLNGPVFPNNDRNFRVPAGKKATVNVVHETVAPDTLHLGIRSGSRPTQVRGRIGSTSFTVDLPPHSQDSISLMVPAADMRFPGYESYPSTLIHHLTVETSTGPVWIEVLQHERQQNNFNVFGPDPSAPPAPLSEDATRILSSIRFLGGEEPRVIDAAQWPLFEHPRGLSAGTYDLEMTFSHFGPEEEELRVDLKSPLLEEQAAPPQTLRIPSGISTQRVTFNKAFSPFEVQCFLDTTAKGLQIQRWSLRPSSDQQIPDPVTPVTVGFEPVDLSFKPGIRLTGLHLQFPETPQGDFSWAVRSEMPAGLSPEDFLETVIFIHLVKQDGSHFQVLDIPLYEATFGEHRVRQHRAVPSGPLDASGPLELRIGMYNVRTRQSLTPFRRLLSSPKTVMDGEAFHVDTFKPPFYGNRYSAE